ncbi:MAG: DUF5690 family protein [Ignavibacteriae bacterium]|nr:DUF5690 family protein [Ignavibacteriota bacterium]
MSIKQKLSEKSGFIFSTYAIISAFGAYSCMIGFRRPYTVGLFEGLSIFGVDYKIALVTSQLLGYILAKFYGIKFISEMPRKKRAFMLILMIVIAELSLVLFAYTPLPYNLIFMFINGIPLGMIRGLVFSYLEGRRFTEVLGAGLSAAFIITSGFAKTMGKIVMDDWGFSEYAMPFITGALFILPYFLFVWMLNQIPDPNKDDESLRTKRVQMFAKDRIIFFKKFTLGIILLTLIYMIFNAYKDYRDNFAADIWKELGYGNQSGMFTSTEAIVTIGVLGTLSLIMLIKNNFKALLANHLAVLLGVLTIGISTFLYQSNILSPYMWILLTGFGAFMGYVPFNAILFDRLIATFKYESNSGFLIYIADSFGYLTSILVMLYKNFGASKQSSLNFFINSGYLIMFLGIILIISSAFYYYKKYKKLNIIKDEH